MKGIVVKSLSSFYYVEANSNIYECKARGNLRKSEFSPLVGDNVDLEILNDKNGIITNVLQRKNALKRPNVSNVDKLFIISSFSNPTPNTYLIDKVAAIATFNNIEPIIVFNKSDMGDFDKFEKIYSNSGFKTYTVSASTGIGLNELFIELKDNISVFTGNSGVGKSSILNRLFKNSNIATGEVSEKLGRGRHTTRHIEAYKLDFGGYVIDTPGFSSIEYDNADLSFKEHLAESFHDFNDYIFDCKFTNCTHTTEKGCSVINAVNNGKIEETRHLSYIKIFEEMKNLKSWEANKNKKK